MIAETVNDLIASCTARGWGWCITNTEYSVDDGARKGTHPWAWIFVPYTNPDEAEPEYDQFYSSGDTPAEALAEAIAEARRCYG